MITASEASRLSAEAVGERRQAVMTKYGEAVTAAVLQAARQGYSHAKFRTFESDDVDPLCAVLRNLGYVVDSRDTYNIYFAWGAE